MIVILTEGMKEQYLLAANYNADTKEGKRGRKKYLLMIIQNLYKIYI